MKFYVLIVFVFYLLTGSYAQIQKVRLVADLSSGYTYNSSFSDLYNRSFASLGIDLEMNKSNVRFYGTYGYSTFIYTPLGQYDIGKNYGGNHSIQIQFLGGTLDYYLFNETKILRPFLRTSLFSELESNYKNGYISYKFYSPLKFDSPPMSTNYSALYYGSHPHDQMFGCAFYHSTPILFNLYGGISFRIVENFRINLSAGYSLSLLKYKNVKWTKYDDFEEMINRTPMQKKALHSIAGQIGLNYVFSFQKKSKTDVP